MKHNFNKNIIGKYVSFSSENLSLYKVIDFSKGYVLIDCPFGSFWESVVYIVNLYDLGKLL